MTEEAIAERRYITPRPRPRVTVGRTIETKTGCGSLYVTINEDEHGIAEVFVKLGKSGGCSASQTEALGKMISLALRCNVNPEEIVRKLKGIRCPNIIWQDGEQITSCADAVAKTLEKYLRGEFDKVKAGAEKSAPLTEFFDVNGNGSSEDVGKEAGIEEGNGAGIEIGNGNGKEAGREAGDEEGDEAGVMDVPVPIPVSVGGNGNGNGSKVAVELAGSPYACPECGSIMQPREGCLTCTSCGYSKCG